MKVHTFTQILMAPFACTVEVFLRKSFGIRYWSFPRFITGIIVIGLFRLAFGLSEIGQSLVNGLMGGKASQSMNWIYGVWLGFILMGCYHFIIQSYHNAINKQILTTSMGESRLLGLGKILLALVNRIANRILKRILPFLPLNDRANLEKKPIHLSDYRGFTYRVVEPLCIFLLSQIFAQISGIVSFWLLVSSLMLAMHSSLNLAKEREPILDMRDAEILQAKLNAQPQPELTNDNHHFEKSHPLATSHSKI